MFQGTISEEALRRLRVHAAFREMRPAEILTELIMNHLPPVDLALRVQEQPEESN